MKLVKTPVISKFSYGLSHYVLMELEYSSVSFFFRSPMGEKNHQEKYFLKFCTLLDGFRSTKFNEIKNIRSDYIDRE